MTSFLLISAIARGCGLSDSYRGRPPYTTEIVTCGSGLAAAVLFPTGSPTTEGGGLSVTKRVDHPASDVSLPVMPSANRGNCRRCLSPYTSKRALGPIP